MIVTGKDLTGKYSIGIISQCLHDAFGIYHSQKYANIIGQCLSVTRINIFKIIMLKKWSGYGLTGRTASSGPEKYMRALMKKIINCGIIMITIATHYIIICKP